MRTMITPDSEPLPRKQIAAMVAEFKRRNPHVVDDSKRRRTPPVPADKPSEDNDY